MNDAYSKEFFWQPRFHDEHGHLVVNKLNEPSLVFSTSGRPR